jgi:hypothetical protein
MQTRTLPRLAALALVAWAVPATGAAQVFGTFPWQMQPYCNVVTLTLTNAPAGLTLAGTDDQCGATNKGSAVGVASFNGGGDVTLNFSIVTAPSGKPVHVSAVVSPANGNGTWTDSVGNSGTLAFFGAVPGLPVRPFPASGLPPSIITTTEIAAGAVGASDINTAEVQARVTGACATGQAAAAVNADGSVACIALPADAGPLRRGTFTFTTIPSTATDVTNAVVLNTQTFTAPKTGTVVAVARGYCNITSLTSGSHDVYIGIALPGEATWNSFSDWSPMRVLATAAPLNEHRVYDAERSIAVTAGAAYTLLLKAHHFSGASASSDCGGSITLRLHEGTFP